MYVPLDRRDLRTREVISDKNVLCAIGEGSPGNRQVIE